MRFMRWAFAALVTATALLALALPGTVSAKEAKYVGVKSCGKCHKKEKQGEQLRLWQESKHSEAFEVLGTPKAKEAAATVGVSGNPQKLEECLVCHTTGFGEPKKRFRRRFKMEDGVQCEACHGAGSEYKKKKVMKKIWEESGPDNSNPSPTAEKTGMLFGNEETCKRCHTQELTLNGKTYKNPSYKDFNYEERLKDIAHPVPK